MSQLLRTIKNWNLIDSINLFFQVG